MFTNSNIVHLVDLSKGSSSKKTQISEALTKIGRMLTGIIHRAGRGRFTERIGQRRPRRLMLREHPAQRRASFGGRQRRERVGASRRGGAGGGRCGRRGKRESALFEGEGLLCVGEVSRDGQGSPGRRSFHGNWHGGRISSVLFNQGGGLENRVTLIHFYSNKSKKYSSKKLFEYKSIWWKVYSSTE